MGSSAKLELPDRGRTAEAVRGLLERHLSAALSELGHKGKSRQRQVHGIRKRMKRSRAATRLLGDANGLDLRMVEANCREVARRLSALRDLDVMIDTLTGGARGARGLPADLLGVLREERERELARGVMSRGSREEMTGLLSDVAAAVADLSLSHVSDDDLEAALGMSHRKARKALIRVGKKPDDEKFHCLRKRAKRELYQHETLLAAGGPGHSGRIERLDRFCEVLGDQQDLSVLRAKAESIGFLSPVLDAWLRDRCDRLREHAVRRAKRIYD